MEGVIIRQMRLGDVDRVTAITAESPETARWTVTDFQNVAERKSAHVLAWVAESSAAVVGFLVLRHAGGEAEILNLAVHPSARRRGCGKRLVQHGVMEAGAAGANRIFLEVRESNRAAMSLYAGCGFAPVGRRARYYSVPVEDALVLTRSL